MAISPTFIACFMYISKLLYVQGINYDTVTEVLQFTINSSTTVYLSTQHRKLVSVKTNK